MANVPHVINIVRHGRSNGLHNVYAIMLRGSRGPDPLTNKKVFAGSDSKRI